MKTAMARIGLLGVFVGVLLFSMFLAASPPVGAEPITTGLDGMTKDSFNKTCKQAGGKAYEIDQGDINYSYCKFPDGGRNSCDWIKKTCTWGGIVAQPGTRTNVGGRLTTVATTGGSSGSGSTRQMTLAGVNGNLVLARDDDD